MFSHLLAGKTGRTLLVLAVVVYLALLVVNAQTTKPWNDEAMAANASYNLGYRGYTGVPFYDEVASGFKGVHQHTYYMLPFQFVPLALWFRIVGVSLFTTRMASMCWSLGGFWILYKLFRKLLGNDSAVPILATGLVMVDYQIMTAASFGRYDTMVATLGFGGYLAYVSLREKTLKAALLVSHALVVCAGATHPNGVFYCLGLCFLMWFYDRRNIGFKELAIAAVPYVTGGILMGLYISQDFESFRAQMARNSGGRFGILHPVDTFMSEIRTRYIAAYGLGAHSAGHDSPLVRLKAIPLVAYLAGAIGFLAFRSVRTKLSYASLFGLGALHWFLLAFYENMKFSYYLVHLVPFYAVILAIFVVHLWQQRAVPKWLIATGLAGVALVQIGGIGMKIRLNNYGNSYAPAVEYVKAHATPQDLVYASCGFGFAYGFDSHYRDDETFGYFSKEKATFIVVEEIYDGQHAYMKAALPDQYAHVQRTLDSYELVYRNAEYRVYQRPNVP